MAEDGQKNLVGSNETRRALLPSVLVKYEDSGRVDIILFSSCRPVARVEEEISMGISKEERVGEDGGPGSRDQG